MKKSKCNSLSSRLSYFSKFYLYQHSVSRKKHRSRDDTSLFLSQLLIYHQVLLILPLDISQLCPLLSTTHCPKPNTIIFHLNCYKSLQTSLQTSILTPLQSLFYPENRMDSNVIMYFFNLLLYPQHLEDCLAIGSTLFAENINEHFLLP